MHHSKRCLEVYNTCIYSIGLPLTAYLKEKWKTLGISYKEIANEILMTYSS